MPFAAALLVAAWAGGGTGVSTRDTAGGLLALHVGLMLAGFRRPHARGRPRGSLPLAGAPAQAARRRTCCACGCRRSTRSTGSPRAPPSSRSVVLSAGIVVGLASFDRGDFDVSMAVALAIWALYAAGFSLRRETGLRGRRFAVLLVAGFALVAIVLPLTHFAS